ncbi:hypothetical protein TWF506_010348 [Arthrobotrys conoides]|uniref:Uncharacterized protein n=1 Tax=Arthrobotrys conoides TaxID=74498 RepID=A0AAN8NRA8_9PEZI
MGDERMKTGEGVLALCLTAADGVGDHIQSALDSRPSFDDGDNQADYQTSSKARERLVQICQSSLSIFSDDFAVRCIVFQYLLEIIRALRRRCWFSSPLLCAQKIII